MSMNGGMRWFTEIALKTCGSWKISLRVATGTCGGNCLLLSRTYLEETWKVSRPELERETLIGRRSLLLSWLLSRSYQGIHSCWTWLLRRGRKVVRLMLEPLPWPSGFGRLFYPRPSLIILSGCAPTFISTPDTPTAVRITTFIA